MVQRQSHTLTTAETAKAATFTLNISDKSKEIAINEANFPNENFRTYVVDNLDTNKSGGLSDAEILDVNRVSFIFCDIVDITGIEYFTELTYLNCSYNKLITVDLSNNINLKQIYCGNNQLNSLDISNNTELTHLDCGNNQLKSLDISNNTELIQLDCRNNQLMSLNVSNNAKLVILICG